MLGAGAGRMATAVLDMTVLAGVGIEQWTQAITGSGGRRGNHPRVAKEAVADAEVQASARREVGRGHGVGILIALVDCRLASGEGFARFGLSETRGVVTGDQGRGQKQRAETEQQRRHQES
ncbi:hypothetical protein D3C77_656710 [compost metagenome]